MHCKCFRELDLDDNQIGELGGFEVMRALTKREQRTCHSAELSHNTTQLTHADRTWQLRANFVSDASQVEVKNKSAIFVQNSSTLSYIYKRTVLLLRYVDATKKFLTATFRPMVCSLYQDCLPVSNISIYSISDVAHFWLY